MPANRQENPCAATGCVGACCRNVTFTNVTAEQLDVLTPDGTNVVFIPRQNFATYKAIVGRQISRLGAANVPPTVYVAPTTGTTYDVLIAGPCPNLQPDSSCGEYRRKPPQCDLFGFATKECAAARRSLGVPQLIAKTIGRRP